MLVTSIFSFSPQYFQKASYTGSFKVVIVNTLPSDKIVHQSKLKAFAEKEMNVTQKVKFVLRRVKDIVGNKHFLLFPQCFQKLSF